MTSRRPSRAAGFTLLEVVLAMSSLAMLTAIIYGAFHLGTRALEKGQNAVVTSQRLRATNDVLVRQIKSAVAYPARNEDEGAFWYFKGTPSTMQFVTAAGLQGGGGQVEVTYAIEDGPRCGSSSPCLLLTENPHISPDSLGKGRVDRAGARSAVLLDGFRHMSFDYWDPDERDPPGYAPRWNPFDHDRLPPAVRIIHRRPAGGRRHRRAGDPDQLLPVQRDDRSRGADGRGGGREGRAGGGGGRDRRRGAAGRWRDGKDNEDAEDDADEKDDE